MSLQPIRSTSVKIPSTPILRKMFQGKKKLLLGNSQKTVEIYVHLPDDYANTPHIDLEGFHELHVPKDNVGAVVVPSRRGTYVIPIRPIKIEDKIVKNFIIKDFWCVRSRHAARLIVKRDEEKKPYGLIITLDKSGQIALQRRYG